MKSIFPKTVNIFLLYLLLGLFSQSYGQWEKFIIDSKLGTPEVVSICDLNGDSKPDVVVNDLSDDKIFLYENNQPYPHWNKHTLDSNLDGAYVTDIGDLDGDGDLDVAASGYLENVVVWYENSHPEWIRHTIAENLTVSGAVSIADIDGDDTLDVVSSGYRQGGDLVWYENNHPTWTKHTIRTDYATEWSWVGDIDGDDAIDVAVCRWYEGEVNWFRNENAGQSWTEFSVDGDLAHASLLYFSDIDGDADMDIAAVGEGNDVVVWYENKYPEWEKHIIDANLDGAWCVVVADIDGDEKPDVAATSKNADLVVWYKNNHPEWEKYIIDSDLDGAILLLSNDIDNDDAVDIIVPGSIEGNLVWYKNPYTAIAQSQSLEVNLQNYFSNDDTLIIKSKLINSENHSVNILAYLLDETLNYKDSIEMYDDGLHDDYEEFDNVYSSAKYIMDIEEAFYWIMLKTIDLDSNFTTYLYSPNMLTNIGPINVSSIEYNSRDNQEYFKLVVQNDGKTAAVKNLTVNIQTSDDRIRGEVFPTGKISLLPTGIIDTIEVPHYFYYIEGYNKDSIIADPIQFEYTVASDNVVYWTGSFTYPQTNTNASTIESSFEFEGLVRNYEVHFPSNFQPDMPAVLCLHGATDDVEMIKNYTLLHEYGNNSGFLTIYPAAYGDYWNTGNVPSATANDVGFISNLIDTLISKYEIDTNRIYCCGFGQGGAFSYKLAGEISNRITAVSSVAGGMCEAMLPTSNPNRNIPALHIHGTEDNYEPWEGTDGPLYLLSVDETVNHWVELNDCSPFYNSVSLPDLDASDDCTVEKRCFYTNDGDTTVILLKVNNGGHNWPGASENHSWEGNKTGDIDANYEIWNFFGNKIITKVKKLESNSLPTSFSLFQNYPNPFNPVTNIKYQIPLNEKRETSNVKLIVYDVLGREVATLVNEKQKPGNYEVEFNSHSGEGRKLSSGVYFYKLTAGSFVETKKLILLK